MIKDLKETVEPMLSSDYKQRFIAEYEQLKYRLEKLKSMTVSWNKLNFQPTCEKSIYIRQIEAMQQYLSVLDERAKIEKIDLI